MGRKILIPTSELVRLAGDGPTEGREALVRPRRREIVLSGVQHQLEEAVRLLSEAARVLSEL